MKKLSSNIDNSRAFSLVEVLVAITILLLVVVSPMTVVTQANNSTSFANEQLVAFFLAQEGLEIVEKGRNDLFLSYFRQGSARITNPMGIFISGNSTTNIFGNCIDGECGVQIANNGTIPTAINCQESNNNCRLYEQRTGANIRSRYVHGGTVPSTSQDITQYTRKIQMEPIMSGGKLREMKVTSTVTWRTGSLIAGQQVQLVTYLSNIYATD